MKFIKKIMVFALSLFTMVTAASGTAMAASASDYITVITDNSTLPDTTCYLTMRQENMSVAWNASYDESDYSVTSGTMDYLYLKVKSSSGTYTYDDPCDIIFTEAGKIAGRSVDITVHIDQVQVYNYSSKEAGTMWSFAAVGPGYWGGGANTLWFWAGSQGGAQKINYTVHVTWHDTGEECNLSFYQCCYDIDVAYTSLTDYKEAWAASLSDYQHFFVYSDSTNTTSITDDNMLKFTSTTQYNVTGDNSITLTGAVGVTKSSTFSGSYWENGGCGTSLEIYSTYANLNEPVKTTDTTKTYSAGDSITWEISYNLGTYYQDVFSPFESIIIKDYLPSAAAYKSAALYNSAGTDITATAGTLTYDESENLVTFSFNEDFLNNTSNYNGTDYVMVINAEIKNLNISYELANTAYAIIDGIEFTSSTPAVEVVNPIMSIEKTADATSYQVGDVITYTITAAEMVEDGTASNVVVSDTLPDELKLLSVTYDTASGTRTDDGSGNSFEIVYASIPYGTVETITVKALVTEATVDMDDETVENVVTNTVTCQYDNAIERGEDPITDECSVMVLEPSVSISKTSDKQSVQIGDDVSWTITVSQGTAGAAVGGDVVVTDVIPEGLSFNDDVTVTGVNAKEASIEYDENTRTLTVTFSEPGYGTAYIEYSTKALATAKGQTLKNCAAVDTEEPDTNYPEDEIEVPVDVFSPSIITEVVNGTITDSDDCILYGSDKVIEYAPDEGYLLESVTVDGESVDITKYPDSYTFTDVKEDHTIRVVYVKPEMSKSVSIEGEDVDGVVVAEGETLTYAIAYENPTGAERDICITDTVPAGAKVVEDSISDSGVYEDGTVTWTFTVEAYCSGSVSFSCIVNDSAKGSIVENSASVTFEALEGSTSEEDVTLTDTVTSPVLGDPKKSVWNGGENVTNCVVTAGDTLTYKIRFANPAEEEKSFTVTDILPDGVTLVEGSISDSGTETDGIVTWTLNLAAGEKKTVTFSVTVDNPVEELAKIYNQATVTVDRARKDTISTNAPEGEDRTPVYVLDEPVKAVLDADGEDIGTDSDGNAIQTIKQSGDEISYRITFQNPAAEAKTFTVTDQLPEGVLLVSADNGGVYDEETHTVTWALTVEADEGQEVTVMVEILKSAEGSTLTNSAVVSVDASSLTTNEVETPVMAEPSKTVSDETGDVDGQVMAVGDTLVYQVSFANPSSETKTFTVTDQLPEGVLFVSADNGGVYEEATHTVTWTVDVQAEQTKTVSVEVVISESAEGDILTNIASVSVDEASLTTNEVETPVMEEPLKAVWQGTTDADGLTVEAGDTLTYQIKFVNPSEEEKTFTVTDELPEGVKFVSADNGGKYDKQSHTVTWTLSVEAGGTQTVSVRVKVTKDAQGSALENAAAVSADHASVTTNRVKTYVEAAAVDAPKTGDSSNVILWAALASLTGAAALLLGGYVLYRRKRAVR